MAATTNAEQCAMVFFLWYLAFLCLYCTRARARAGNTGGAAGFWGGRNEGGLAFYFFGALVWTVKVVDIGHGHREMDIGTSGQ